MTDARGSVSMIVVAGVLVLAFTALGAADLGSMLFARSKAQAAADAAALAAVVAQVEILGHPGDPVAEAEAMAAANGATLVMCSCEVGDTRATVEVTVTPGITLIDPWRDRPVRARASAAVDPDVLSYRDGG